MAHVIFTQSCITMRHSRRLRIYAIILPSSGWSVAHSSVSSDMIDILTHMSVFVCVCVYSRLFCLVSDVMDIYSDMAVNSFSTSPAVSTTSSLDFPDDRGYLDMTPLGQSLPTVEEKSSAYSMMFICPYYPFLVIMYVGLIERPLIW